MSKVASFFLVLLIRFSVSAYGSSFEYCKAISKVAKRISSARQNGVSAVDLHELLIKRNESKAMYRLMIKEAFDAPLFSSENNKQKEISEFESKWFLICLEANNLN